jgi:nucleoside-diphosphate-sugar epimerase
MNWYIRCGYPIYINEMILVTGGTGLLGAHLLYELSQMNQPVRAIFRTEERLNTTRKIFSYYSDTPDVFFNRIEWFQADMTDPVSIGKALEGADQVYHIAASVSFDPSRIEHIIGTNVQGTASIVDQCLEHDNIKFCFVSSTAALGEAPQGEKVIEDYIWKGSMYRSVYSVSKFKSELEVWRGIAEGLNAVIINPSIIIGPGDWTRSSSSLFLRIWKGMKFYTEGVTGYVDVMDVVKVMISLMNSTVQGERFIVSSENLSYKQVFTAIALALQKRPPSMHAGRYLTQIACKLDWMRSFITGWERQLSPEMVRASSRKLYFSNEKVIRQTGLRFRLIEQSIQATARLFLKDINTGEV